MPTPIKLAIDKKAKQIADLEETLRLLTLGLHQTVGHLQKMSLLSERRRVTSEFSHALVHLRRLNLNLRKYHTELDRLREKKANGIVTI